MPGGGRPLNFTYYVRSDGETGPEIGEFVTGWLREIGYEEVDCYFRIYELAVFAGRRPG